jgi:hypothetical protein
MEVAKMTKRVFFVSDLLKDEETPMIETKNPIE